MSALIGTMLPLNKSQIPGLFKKARMLEQSGKLAEARQAYENILRLDRAHGPSLFQLGQIHYKMQDMPRAVQNLDRAAQLHPAEPAIWKLYGRAVADLNDPAAVQSFLKKAKKARVDRKLLLALQDMFHVARGKTRTPLGAAPPQEVKRAIDLLQAGRAEDAVKVAQRLRDAHPDVAIIADILANAQGAVGDTEAAEENFRAAARLDPNYAETHSNFGRFLVELGRIEEGVAELQQALKLAPKMVSAMVHMGVALERDNKQGVAKLAFRRALDIAPDTAEARLEYGRILLNEQKADEALSHLRRAEALGAKPTEVRSLIAGCLSAMGQEEQALEVLDAILEQEPENAEVIASRAMIFQTLGRFDDAEKAFRKAIALDPRNGRFYRNFLTSKKLAADDPLIALMEQGFADPDISDISRINFGFALSKAMEDSKQFDRVFTYLKPANDLMRQKFPFHIEALQEQTEALKDTFRAVDFKAINIPGRSEYAPIFVTGLPRSGTTLVEQIVASHSAVTGGGELGFARREWGDTLIRPDASIIPWDSLSDQQIVDIGHRTERQMRALYPGADIVTDKSVQSYMMIGPIRASLPNARFVIVKRDPRDNLLSMYKNLFVTGKHLHSYNQSDLAAYYRLFEDILAFWQEQVPGWFHVIQYEDLIADPEAEARKLIAACGLDWEDQCLSFYENKRRVDTLSVHQVRQPIYSSSMGAWKRYESDLTEMLTALGGEYAPGAKAEDK